jgi:lipoprotein-anchoring transpeptidase ErfK/SrfK
MKTKRIAEGFKMDFFTFFDRRKLYILLVAGALIDFTGCVPPENGTTSTPNVNTNTIATNTNTNTAKPAENRQTSLSMPVTLPVLDAMFTDEQFAGELKTKLQLTDEQINQLKQVSNDAVGSLSESETEDYSGSTRASTERAANEIRRIVGDEKADQLFEIVRTRWQGGDAQTMAAANPGAVPTDTRIVVNAPAYRMDVFQDGKLVKTYKVGIGYPEFPLPGGIRKAETLIFNPTWTPPDEPWVKGKVQPGKTVEAGSKLNPLGPVKIPIGLPSLIHGGKAPARLGTFASHGCVGLTDSQIKDFSLELAKISGTEITLEDINNYGKNKTETKNVKLARAVPVELRYETIVVENGVLKIFRDVYERGMNTEENLRRVLDAYGVAFDSINQAERDKILAGLQQMAYDAQGNPVEQSANTNMNSNSNASNNKNANSNSDKVTKNIKGKKEVAFQLAELQGKGYPAAVNAVNQ